MKKAKGEHGYIAYQRIRVLIITIILYMCAAGLYLIGYCTLHTHRNLWTVFSVLSILPASKSLVNLIMFLRFKSLDLLVYDVYETAIQQIPSIYELPFTTYEKTYFVDVIACIGNTVAGCYLGKPGKKSTHEQDVKRLSEHLETVLKNDGHKDFTIKIFDNRQDFLRRINEMNSNLSYKCSASDEGILNTLRAVSL